MNILWLLRMKRWVQNPPSRRRVIGALIIVGLVLAVAIAEALGLWPSALTLERGPGWRGIGR